MKSIEKLVLWLLPAELLGVILHSVFQYFSAWNSVDHGSRSLVATLAVASGLSYLIGHLVIGIWLYYKPHRSLFISWVWLIFGVTTGFWALGIFLLLQIPYVRFALESEGTSSSSSPNA
ncbi:hypothetical protein [Geothrix limicola]|uniref:hypothetical protein n=1 Tax=Geothrix limicola TaxID=2927978 RepID=UPI002552CD7F|nr:hypothetical protein [Geothrix limicola]